MAVQNQSPLLAVGNLTKRFGGLLAVDKVSFEVTRQSITSIMGPNGAGKTTMFNLITGFLSPTSGWIYFKGQPIQGERAHSIVGLGIARTFQNVRLFSHLTVLENVMVGASELSFGTTLGEIAGVRKGRAARAERLEKAGAQLDAVGLGSRGSSLPTALPYGDQRRVEIARALATEPDLLILDEPSAGMTHGEANEVLALIRRLREAGLTILLVEHNVDMVMRISDAVVVLDFGTKIADGPPQDVQHDPAVVRAYLGAAEDGSADVV